MVKKNNKKILTSIHKYLHENSIYKSQEPNMNLQFLKSKQLEKW